MRCNCVAKKTSRVTRMPSHIRGTTTQARKETPVESASGRGHAPVMGESSNRVFESLEGEKVKERGPRRRGGHDFYEPGKRQKKIRMVRSSQTRRSKNRRAEKTIRQKQKRARLLQKPGCKTTPNPKNRGEEPSFREAKGKQGRTKIDSADL